MPGILRFSQTVILQPLCAEKEKCAYRFYSAVQSIVVYRGAFVGAVINRPRGRALHFRQRCGEYVPKTNVAPFNVQIGEPTFRAVIM